jgi:polyisoprenoid-binding protein YceI
VRYRFDPGKSRFTVQAFASGMLSFLGHSPTFAVRDFTAELRLDPGSPAGAGLEVIVRADSLELVDKVRPADRQEIEGRMRGEVLETAAYPEIRFEAAEVATYPVSQGQYRLRAVGRMALRGVSSRLALEAPLALYDDGVRLGGEFPLRMSEYRIRPVTALGGTIKLRDELRVAFDLVAWKEDT